MDKKLKFVIIIIPLALSVLGLSSIYSKFAFYRQSFKAQATITKISDTDLCQHSYRNCKYSRDVNLSFTDFNNKKAIAKQELSTITLISGVFMEGDSVRILYFPNQPRHDYLESIYPIKNLGPVLYERVEIYTWHYWVYPFLLTLIGPLLYLSRKKIGNKLEAIRKTNWTAK